MRVVLKDGYLIAEWEGKPQKEVLKVCDLVGKITDKEFQFLDDIRRGNYDLEESRIDLRCEPYKLSKGCYWAYLELNWVIHYANKYGVELDESVMTAYIPLRDKYLEMREAERISHIRSLEAQAEEKYQEDVAKIGNSCDYCRSCIEVIDGDLWCKKYRKDLEVSAGEKYTASGQHLMFASHGVMLDCCKEDKLKELAEEKAKYIQERENLY
jgi:hypothetical protein